MKGHQANPIPFCPIWSFGPSPLQRRNNQFFATIPVTVRPADSMQRRFGPNRKYGPGFIEILRLLKPLEGSTRFRIGRHPLRPQGHIQAAVPINIVDCKADIEFLGDSVNHDMFLPARVFKPNRLSLVYRNNVGLTIPIDVCRRHGIPQSKIAVDNL